ncbi:MAG: PQQ-binding-like beta-propeller repeat protein [Lentisphaerae bacterium]|jgi:outer membrane protein assembly factor BamB|nr:PQQ-binding-like beta-propeller repeat protein [Lentisphaerota bacterium]MBT5609402.1 PQQ-binding-like beta-propeller repeat protein [Lentisphaerota bacterium]MBT7060221.1 PQQ-binding-like beta-propeller repeat protein [Lentisphaerota bacterium]MBT7841710.1 PQQ-binding-like beta-propeller repeat protein [Lentisphaerota bacterium]
MLCHCMRRSIGALLASSFLTSLVCCAEMPKLLQDAGIRQGVCLHLACVGGDGAGLTAEIAGTSDLLVHGLALDVEACRDVRDVITARGLQGKAMVELLRGGVLPYVSGLADLVVVGDAAALVKRGVDKVEIARVLALGGVIMTKTSEGWRRETKARPQDAQAWTHPFRGPDGNRVVPDAVSWPVGLRWQDGLPINIGHWASTRSWVAAEGRVFSITMTEAANIRTGPGQAIDKKQWLVARNAANGLPLWKIPLGTSDPKSDLTPLNTLPLATNGKLVLARKENSLVAVDAASGEIVRTFPVAHPPARLLLIDRTVVVVGWETLGRVKMWDSAANAGSSLWDVRVPKTGVGMVEAFDVDSGKCLWQDPVPAQTILASGGAAVYLVQGLSPVTEQVVVARDVATGKERWRTPHSQLGEGANFFLAGVGSGVAVLARHKPGTVNFRTRCREAVVLSLKDGAKLWESEADGDAHVLFVEDELWYGSTRYRPATGEALGKSPFRVDRGMCLPPVLLGSVGGSPRGGRWTDVGTRQALTSGGVRAACIQGVAVADRRIYIAQNWCRCAPAQVPGFLALGAETPPLAAEFAAVRPVERSKVTRPSTDRAGPAAWPTFRGNPARSGAIGGTLGTALDVRWTQPVSPAVRHAIGRVWTDALQPRLSAPVADATTVYVAACSQGEVIAIDLASGREKWRAQTGARVDAPPTLHLGLCLVGSHDGWLYALRSDDGEEVWRTRIAPQERRIVAFGQVESSWPVVGAPLVVDGVGYAIAGRSTEMDGGCALVAFDPRSGETRWAARVTGVGRRADVLAWRRGRIAMQYAEFDPQNGKRMKEDPAEKWRRKGNLDGIIEASWTRVGTRRSGNLAAGNVAGDVLVWDDGSWFGFTSKKQCYGCFAIEREAALAANPKTPQTATYRWQWKTPRERQVEGLVLTAESLVAAGRIKDTDAAKVRGFLALLSRETGVVQAELGLPSPPVLHGVCVVSGKTIVCLENGSVVCLGAP